MSTDAVEFWNEVWGTSDHTDDDHDALLEVYVRGLTPGRALEFGCGTGGNALWLAEQGWRVTAIDYSDVAICKAGERAESRALDAKFVVADASTYRPKGQYDLITSFYIQMPPEQRVRMLLNSVESLAPGGVLLFVSHDKSAPPSGWNDDDLDSLTTPDEVAAEIPGLRIDQAVVLKESGAHMSQMTEPDEEDGHEHHGGPHEDTEETGHSHGASTVVVAVKPR